MFSLRHLLTGFCFSWLVLGVRTSCPDSCKCRFSSVDCQRGELAEIPRDLPSTIKLLSVTRNNLNHLPENAFTHLQKLEELRLPHNKITRIATGAFNGLRNLKELALDYNEIRVLRRDMLQGLPNLRNLYLEHNAIARVDGDAFLDMPYLEGIYLGHNLLTDFPWSAANRMKSLQSLNLRFNRISVLRQRDVGHLLEKILVHLHGNPWHCNCEIFWFCDWLRTPPPEIAMHMNKYVCASPDHNSGRRFADVPLANLTCRAPLIINPPLDLEVQKGATIELHCIATGDPRPSIQWVTPKGHIVSTGQGSNQVLELEDSILEVRDASIENNGRYTCIASNLLGNRTSDAYVTVSPSGHPTGPPQGSYTARPTETPYAANLTISDITPTSATLMWIPEDRREARYKIMYFCIDDDDIVRSKKIEDKTSLYTIEDLIPASQYTACLHVEYVRKLEKTREFCVDFKTLSEASQNDSNYYIVIGTALGCIASIQVSALMFYHLIYLKCKKRKKEDSYEEELGMYTSYEEPYSIDVTLPDINQHYRRGTIAGFEAISVREGREIPIPVLINGMLFQRAKSGSEAKMAAAPREGSLSDVQRAQSNPSMITFKGPGSGGSPDNRTTPSKTGTYKEAVTQTPRIQGRHSSQDQYPTNTYNINAEVHHSKDESSCNSSQSSAATSDHGSDKQTDPRGTTTNLEEDHEEIKDDSVIPDNIIDITRKNTCNLEIHREEGPCLINSSTRMDQNDSSTCSWQNPTECYPRKPPSLVSSPTGLRIATSEGNNSSQGSSSLGSTLTSGEYADAEMTQTGSSERDSDVSFYHSPPEEFMDGVENCDEGNKKVVENGPSNLQLADMETTRL
ncbi:Leucine-rich repeat and fibronectin type III domain-containing protein 1 [Branchiostoma belcheri]|nr:Leucine-rich repeat and fibronectin type III domain-containing protein 1 [Branchiostoma belcheri]